jgi:hypothetical protein
MVGPSRPNKAVATKARNRADQSDRLVEPFQLRTLLDVQFEINGDVLRTATDLRQIFRVVPAAQEGFTQSEAAGIFLLKQMIVQHSCHCPAADGRHTEVGRLFREKTDNFHRVSENCLGLLQTPRDLQRPEDADHPVEPAAAVDRIDVRPKYDRRKSLPPWPPSHYISNGIDLDLEARLLESLRYPTARLFVPLRKRAPGKARTRRIPEGRKRLKLLGETSPIGSSAIDVEFTWQNIQTNDD